MNQIKSEIQAVRQPKTIGTCAIVCAIDWYANEEKIRITT